MDPKEVLEFIESQCRLPFVEGEAAEFSSRISFSKRIKKFHVATDEKIYIDVTDTDSCPIITGIQRVVRQVVASFVEDKIPFELIRFDFETNGFVVLSDIELRIFLDFLRPQNGFSNPKPLRSSIVDSIYTTARASGHFLISAFQSFGKFGIFAELVDAIESSKSGLVRKIRSRKKELYELSPLIPVKGIKMLLPELIYEKGRVEQYLSLKMYYDAKINVILYDLIPIYHPNLVEVSKEFLQYLRVVRASEKIIAISEYSADQMTAYIEGWKREQGAISAQVSSIYLPFSKQASDAVRLPKYDVPTFIFVSTLEPRKNHLRLILAAHRLKQAGYSFEVICVGKIGWLGNATWRQINGLLADGAPVKLLHSVSDVQLREILLRSWCAIYPSIVEGFGLPIIEADQFDLPVIVSNNSAMRDVAKKFIKSYQFIDPESVESIFSAMKSFLEAGDKSFMHNTKIESLSGSWKEYSHALYERICR